MKTFQLKIQDGEDENIIKILKIECAKTDRFMKDYIIEAIKEKMERERQENK